MLRNTCQPSLNLESEAELKDLDLHVVNVATLRIREETSNAIKYQESSKENMVSH